MDDTYISNIANDPVWFIIGGVRVQPEVPTSFMVALGTPIIFDGGLALKRKGRQDGPSRLIEWSCAS